MEPRATSTVDEARWLERVLRLLPGVVLVILGLLCNPGAAVAQTDFFLHRDANVLVLNLVSPDSPALTFAASPPVTRRLENPWREVGTWSTFQKLPPFIGVFPVAHNLNVWLGLKNSDDIGTAFDLRAEVKVLVKGVESEGVESEGVLVAEGMTQCIAGVARDLSRLKQVIVELDPKASLQDGIEGVTLKISARIGTSPPEGQCAGHASAMGLRVYFGGIIDQPSKFDLLLGLQ